MSGSSDYTRTTNYAFYKPNFDADIDQWGTHWNWNADTLDSTLHGLSVGQAGGPFLPLSGGTIQPPGPLTGNSATSLTITDTAAGSGVNGPATAQFGIAINHAKANWNNATQSSVGVGEIDGLNVMCRQGGNNSDCGGILINVQSTGLSFLAAMEMASTVVTPGTGTITKYSNVQLASHDGVTGNSFGAVIQAAGGTLNDAIHVQDNNAGSTWANVLTNTRNNVQNFAIDGNGNITTSGSVLINNVASGVLTVQGNNAATTVAGANIMWGNMPTGGLGGATYLLNNKGGGSGGFLFGEVTNAGAVTPRLTIDGSGNVVAAVNINTPSIHATGSVYLRSDTGVGITYNSGNGSIEFDIGGNAAQLLGSGGLTIFGTKVVGTQIAGWGTPTGGSRIASFPGGTATAAQTAQALAQLILDLKTHGLLGV